MINTICNPNPVQHYHDYLQQGLPPDAFVSYRRAYIRNISYALQYCEYIADALLDDTLNSVVRNQMVKTFIITGCGIVESILWMLLKGSNSQVKNKWEELQSRVTNSYTDCGVEHRFEVRHLRRRLQPVDIEMRFIDMCRMAERKHLLGISSDVYAQIGHLRSLRNRVHIHSVQHDRDNDWWTFSVSDYFLMKGVLKAVLRAEIFSPYPNYDQLFYWMVAPTLDK